MANRVLIGNRATGGYGLYVSEPGADVLTAGHDDLTFWTDSGETGSNFVSKGIHQTVPWSGGTGSTAPVVTNSVSISAGATASLTYTNLGGDPFLVGGFALGTSAANNNVKLVNFSSISATGATGSAPGVGATFNISVFKTLGGGAADY